MRVEYPHLPHWVRGAGGINIILDCDKLDFPKGFRILESQVIFSSAIAGPEDEPDTYHLSPPSPI